MTGPDRDGAFGVAFANYLHALESFGEKFSDPWHPAGSAEQEHRGQVEGRHSSVVHGFDEVIDRLVKIWVDNRMQFAADHASLQQPTRERK